MYDIPGMRLVPQKKNMGCWFASAQMVIQWKREHRRASLRSHPDPSQVPQTVSWEVSNLGIVNAQVIELATALGLKTVPPMTPNLALIEQWLRDHGPLWTNGKGHIVVIGGVDQDQGRIRVYDPWPPGKGIVEWRDYGLYLNSSKAFSRDTGADVQAVFLYHP